MAISANTVWEVRTTGSDSNSGGFVAGASGTDRSQSDTSFANGTNLTVDAVTNTDVAPDGYSPVAADVGNLIQITAGAGFSTGFYQIASIQSGKWRLDRSPAATGTSGGTWRLGGALLTLGKLASGMATSNKAFVKSGTYSISSGVTFGTAQAVVTNSVPPNRLIGYASSRGDIVQSSARTWENNASRPVISASSTGFTLLTLSNGGWVVENLDINCNSQSSSSGLSMGGNPSVARNIKVRNFRSRGVTLGGNGQTLENSEVTGGASGDIAVLVNAFGQLVQGCYIHDNALTSAAVQIGASASGCVVDNVIANNTGATMRGIRAGSDTNITILNNTIHGNGLDGIEIPNRWWGIQIRGNLITSNGRYGIANTAGAGSAAGPWWDGNAFYNNTSGARNQIDDTTTNPVNGVAAYSNVLDVTLTADPYVNAAGQNYNLNNTLGGGNDARGAATPGLSYSGLASASYRDFGANQYLPDFPAVGRVRLGTSYDDGNLVGTLVLPGVDDVRNGVGYGEDGSDFTGDLVLPVVGDVEGGVGYGANGAEFTGTFAVPAAANVRIGIGYGADGTEFTGTYDVSFTGSASNIGDAVVAAVQSLSLVSNGSVVRRKIPALPRGENPPQIVVSIAEEGRVEHLDFENNVLVTYPCAVTIVTGGGDAMADDDTLRTWRRRVRQQVDNPDTFAGVTGFLEVTADMRAPFDPAALPKDLNFSVVVFGVAVIEARHTVP